MKKVFFLVWMVLTTLPLMAIVEGRWSLSLNGGGWNLWLDHSAAWQHDRLYLPEEATDLSLLPVNAPTGGWDVLDRACNDGTTVVVSGSAETWMEGIAKATGSVYRGFYTVGRDWIGGIHFVKAHPLFSGLPVNTSMNWPYQQVVRDGDNRYGFNFEGGELVAGSYRSTPFHLGTAVGVVSYGKGKIIFSSLDIVGNLLNSDSAAETARKLFCNFVGYHE